MRPGAAFGRGGPAAMMKGEKARNFKGTMKKLIGALSPFKLRIFIVFIFAVGSTVFSILGPKILGKATTKLFEGVMAQMAGKSGGIDLPAISQILLSVLGLYLVSALFSYIQGWIMSRVSIKITYQFRKDILAKINRMPLRYFDGTNHGEVLSRMTNDVDTVNQTLSQSLTQMITSLVAVLGVLVMMLTISWQMTLVALLILPLSMVLIRLIVNQSQKYFKQQQEFLGHANGHIEEMFGSHAVVKAFSGEAKNMAKFEGINDSLYRSAWKSQFLSGIMMPMMNFVGNLGYVGVTIMGGYLAAKKAISLGDIQAFIQYMRNFTHPIAQVAQVTNLLQSTVAAAERVFEFLEGEEETEEHASCILGRLSGDVDFEHVRFGYDKAVPVIKDFSAKVGQGMKVAIVGPTGAGKTTMVKLLMRFYELDGGKISIDGKDISTL
ncbi:MAG: multidrug ABC transporter ATP-binding protein, partial [Candidatus Melainabacteria bacterium HGW-Melainabacteria-1]